MRYVIVGAGAVGGAIGGRLAEHGFDVVLVARGEHARVLGADGLTLETPEGTVRVHPPVVDGPAALEPRADDVLILTTKTQDSAAVLATLAALPVAVEGRSGATAGDLLPVVCAQNGVENERLALRQFARVYGICVLLPAVHLEPGLVEAAGTPYTALLDLGRYPERPHPDGRQTEGAGPASPAPPGPDPLAVKIAADMTASRMLSEPQERIMPWKYAKLLRNLGNAVDALVGRAAAGPVDRLARDEGEAVLRAAGIDWVADDEWDARRGGQVGIGPVRGRARAGGSTWQSVARGTGSVETAYLSGEIILLGRTHGVPTPVNELLAREVSALVRRGDPAGSLDAAELARRVEAVAAGGHS